MKKEKGNNKKTPYNSRQMSIIAKQYVTIWIKDKILSNVFFFQKDPKSISIRLKELNELELDIPEEAIKKCAPRYTSTCLIDKIARIINWVHSEKSSINACNPSIMAPRVIQLSYVTFRIRSPDMRS